MQIIKGIAIAAVLIIAGVMALHGLGNAGLQSEETITLLAIENSKPHKDGLLFRICQYVEFKQRARRENEKL